MRNKTLE